MNNRSMVEMHHKVSIFVPSTMDVDKRTDNSAFVDYAATELSRLYGGATATTGSGFWLSDICGLVKEDVTIVFAYAADVGDTEQIFRICDKIRDGMKQEAVSCEIDGTFYLI